MKIRKINPEKLNSHKIFDYYKSNNEKIESSIFLDEYYEVENAPFFPIYLAERDENIRKDKFLLAFEIMRDSYLELGLDLILDKYFWYSLFLTELKEKIKEEYPKSLETEKNFRNIVFKKFDWESYVYKIVLGSKYILEEVENLSEHEKYFELIVKNLDIYNYILKSEIFRNGSFLKKVLDVIDKKKCSEIIKSKVKDEVKKRFNIDLKNDERVGRRVISEFSKSYPVVFVHALEYNEFEEYFIKYLNMYRY